MRTKSTKTKTKPAKKKRAPPKKSAPKPKKRVRTQRIVRTTPAVARARGKLPAAPVSKPVRAKPPKPVKPVERIVTLPTKAEFLEGLVASGACSPAISHFQRHGLRRGYETMKLGYFGWAAWRYYNTARTRSLFKAVAAKLPHQLSGDPWNYGGAYIEHEFQDLADFHGGRAIAESLLPFSQLMRRIADVEKREWQRSRAGSRQDD